MAISYVGVAKALGATDVTLPSHATGDLFIYAENIVDELYEPPTGYKFLAISGLDGYESFLVSYKFATSASETAPTARGSGVRIVSVYRGVGAIADVSVVQQSSTTTKYPYLPFNFSDSNSWVVGVYLGQQSDGLGAPSGMTLRDSHTYTPGITHSAAIYDTNGTASSWADTNGSDTGTSDERCGVTIQLLPVDLISGGAPVIEDIVVTEANSATSISVAMPSTVNAGDLLVFLVGNNTTTDFDSDPSGWSSETAGGTDDDIGKVYYKVAAGDEDGTTVAISTGATSTSWLAVCLRITNWDGALGTGWESGVNSANAASSRTPPARTPGWNEKTLFLVGWTTIASAGHLRDGVDGIRMIGGRFAETTSSRVKMYLGAVYSGSGSYTFSTGSFSGTSRIRAFSVAIRGLSESGALFWAFP